MVTALNRNVTRANTNGITVESDDDDPGIRGLSSLSISHQLASGASHDIDHDKVSTTSHSPRSSMISSNRDSSEAQAHHPVTPRSLLKAQPRVSHHNGSFPINYLDTAIVDQLESESPISPAMKLDQYILGRSEVAPEEAHGSISKPGSAMSSLQDVFSNSSTKALEIPRSERPRSVSSAFSWTSSSSSATSSSSESDMSPPDYSAAGSLKSRGGARVDVDTKSSTSKPSNLRGGYSTAGGTVLDHIPIKHMIKRVCVSGLEPRHGREDKFCFSLSQIKDVCRAAQDIFLSEPSLLRLDGPIKIVGDIHGQFKDLMRLFKRGGMPPDQHYLFLGDFVDRGKQSMETIFLLLLLKMRYPSRVHLLRGNHESASITKVYGFYDECKRRSSIKAWRAFIDVFNTLPLAAIVGGRIFCVHGGISPSLTSMDQIEALQRPTDIPEQGILADLLWSDPDPQVKEWSENDRGVSFCFGQRSLDRFCRQLDVDLVVRGHMVVEGGYEFFGNRRLVTVFSAPNYCGEFDNAAAVMNVSDTLMCSFDVIQPRHSSRSGRNSVPNVRKHHHHPLHHHHHHHSISGAKRSDSGDQSSRDAKTREASEEARSTIMT